MTAGSPLSYTIGFVASDQARATSLGTGTLVRIGKLRGVITAAHVIIEALEPASEIGFVNFTQESRQPQGLRLPPGPLEYVKIEQRPWSEFGPDLAFLKLPEQTANSLAKFCSFLNLPEQAELSGKSPPSRYQRVQYNTRRYRRMG